MSSSEQKPVVLFFVKCHVQRWHWNNNYYAELYTAEKPAATDIEALFSLLNKGLQLKKLNRNTGKHSSSLRDTLFAEMVFKKSDVISTLNTFFNNA